MLEFLYETLMGRMLLKILIRPHLSVFCGKMLDAKWSKCLIPYFLRKNHISLEEYVPKRYESFNDCFCRKIKRKYRPVDMRKNHLASPCDGYVSVYPIKRGMVLPVKQSHYRLSDLLHDEELAREYEGGICYVFRLCVHHYHRYCYPDNARKEGNTFIPGVLHTVRPIALRSVPVFTENAREYTVLHTENFGDVVQMEVGAMLVGRIKNLHEEARVRKGQEKGYFEYGGSTIILLVKKGEVTVSPQWLAATKRHIEIPVKQGQSIGKRGE